jgi:hypothetical protein
MRCLCLINNPLFECCRHLIVAVCILALPACDGSRSELQSELESLRAQVESQGVILGALQSAHEAHRSTLNRLSEWEHVRFRVDNVTFDVVEKAFEPLILGEAKLELTGEAQPELIFVEWVVIVHLQDAALEPATYTQRVENGSATLRIVHPLPSHGIGKDQIRLEVKPTGWYLAHMAKLAQ